MIGAVLSLLTAAPALIDAARSIFSDETGGEQLPQDASPEQVAERIEALPPEQRNAVVVRLYEHKERLQGYDTDRFKSLTDGDAAKVAATARPEIAKQAMAVVTMFARGISILFVVTVLEWFARLVCAAAGWGFPEVSLWDLIAKAAPVTEMIWAPMLGSFWACVEIIKKYMGARERDKAQQYEIMAGRPLSSAAATVEAAGGALTGLVKAWRGGRG